MIKEISVNDITDFRIGQAEDREGATGITVVIAENGASAGIDIRGGGPAGRETSLLDPMTDEKKIHAIALAGGSAFGLDAAGGIMKYLEEKDIGYDVGITKVPLVCQSDIFDLTVGDYRARPTAEMGYEACIASESGNYKDGSYGAGTGASVGKILGMEHAMKSGIGSYALNIGDFKIGAISVVNALGDIFDYETGEKLAGAINEDGSFISLKDRMYENLAPVENRFVTNTTISVIITNATFSNVQLCKISGMAHNGYARAINPVHTTADGDTIYTFASGKVQVDLNTFGTLAADVIAEAIKKAVTSVRSEYGLKGLRD